METVDAVKQFYLSDDISACFPGMKDFVSVKTPAGREHQQKRRLLGNLRELYQAFKERNPGLGVGFSKFAMLRPECCVFAGPTGTHTVCVCPIHQNFKLMLMSK